MGATSQDVADAMKQQPEVGLTLTEGEVKDHERNVGSTPRQLHPALALLR